MSNKLDTPVSANSVKSDGHIKVSNVMKDDFGFEVPIESVPLPSLGIIYPQEGPLHGKETIDIRAMTAREEDILTSQALIRKGTVVATLLQSVVLDQGIDVGDMLLGDRNALMMATRVTGYGPKYVVEVKCPSCSTRQPVEFNLSAIPIKRLKIDPIQEGVNLFEYVLGITPWSACTTIVAFG